MISQLFLLWCGCVLRQLQPKIKQTQDLLHLMHLAFMMLLLREPVSGCVCGLQVPSWRAVTFLAAVPCILYPALLPSIYESPSWLLSVGRKVRCSTITTTSHLTCNSKFIVCLNDNIAVAFMQKMCRLPCQQ